MSSEMNSFCVHSLKLKAKPNSEVKNTSHNERFCVQAADVTVQAAVLGITAGKTKAIFAGKIVILRNETGNIAFLQFARKVYQNI
jgi:hypothetical protein